MTADSEEQNQIELEQQERLLLDPEYRKEFEKWLDSLNKPIDK